MSSVSVETYNRFTGEIEEQKIAEGEKFPLRRLGQEGYVTFGQDESGEDAAYLHRVIQIGPLSIGNGYERIPIDGAGISNAADTVTGRRIIVKADAA